MMRLASVVAVLCAVACTKADPPGSTSTTASSAAPATSAPAAAQVSAATAAAAAPATAGAFAGTYDAKASTLYLPDTPEMKKVKWRGDEATTGLGAGELSLTIDADGRVHGECKGALGTLGIEGRAEGDRVAATLRPKDTESGFTGTLEATKKSSVMTGQMNLTDYNAGVLRVATFELASK